MSAPKLDDVLKDPEKYDYQRPSEAKVTTAIATFERLLKLPNPPLDAAYYSAYATFYLAESHFYHYSEQTQEMLHISGTKFDCVFKTEDFQNRAKKNRALQKLEQDIKALFTSRILQFTPQEKPKGWIFFCPDKPPDRFEIDICLPKPDEIDQIVAEFQDVEQEISDDDRFSREAQEARINQIGIILEFTTAFMNDYYPLLCGGKPTPQQLKFQEQFTFYFPRAIPSIFFSSPVNVDSSVKQTIIHALSSLADFFKIYASALQKKPQDIFSGIKQDFKNHPLIPEEEELFPLLCEKAQEALSLELQSRVESADQKKLMELTAFFISTAFIQPILNSLSPDLFNLAIKRLLLRDIDLSVNDPTEFPLSLYSDDDKEFSRNFSEAAAPLLQNLLNLGDAGFFTKKGTETIFSFFKEKAGSGVQKALNKLFNSGCILMPVLVLRELFYDGAKPALTDFFNTQYCKEASSAEEPSIGEQINERIRNLLVNHCNALTKISGFDKVCSLLADRLYLITQDERLCKLLLIFLLDGVVKALKHEDPAVKK